MSITTVLFDWDGTLCDSAAASLRAFQKMFSEFGIDFTRERHDEIYEPDWYAMYRALDFPRVHWERADERWLHHFRDEQPELAAGVSDALSRLRGRGMRLGIVSGGTRARIERELRRMGLAETFGALVCNEDVSRRKPHPEGLEKAMAVLGAAASECCFVGDTREDIEMGRAAGVMTVAVTSGYVGERRLAGCGADAVIPGVRELPDLLAK